jgi:hypothetical protein
MYAQTLLPAEHASMDAANAAAGEMRADEMRTSTRCACLVVAQKREMSITSAGWAGPVLLADWLGDAQRELRVLGLKVHGLMLLALAPGSRQVAET